MVRVKDLLKKIVVKGKNQIIFLDKEGKNIPFEFTKKIEEKEVLMVDYHENDWLIKTNVSLDEMLKLNSRGFQNLVELGENKTIGTSFFDDTITASLNELQSIFGGYFREKVENKVSVRFELELKDGTIFKIYDWVEEQRPLQFKDKFFTFNIGAMSNKGSIKACDFIEEKLKEIREERKA